MPYIVIGRLQKEKYLDYHQYSNYKLRYKMGRLFIRIKVDTVLIYWGIRARYKSVVQGDGDNGNV